MSSIRFSFVIFCVIIFHNGFALHYKYDPRWKWKENQFVDLNREFYNHKSDDPDTLSEINTLPSSTYPPVVQGTSEGTDEDLLDLMVRIAETPSEWEKIHQVLNQLGRSKMKSNTSYKNMKKESVQPFQKSSTTNPSAPSKPTNEKNLDEDSMNPITVFLTDKDNEIRKEDTVKLVEYNGHITDKQTWPDIFKNEYEKLFWNAQNIYDEEMKDEDDDDEENYFSEYQLDEEDKSVNKQNNVYSFNRIDNAVSKVPSKTNVNRKESRSHSKLRTVNNVNKSLSDPIVVKNSVDKYDFVHFLNTVTSRPQTPLVNPVNTSIHDNTSTTKDDNWPNFSYHRVTVSPKEEFKNLSKAFIVVSEIAPKNNVTVATNVNTVGDKHHDRERGLKPVESESHQGTEARLFNSEIPRDGRVSSKGKVYRHHWRDKQLKRTHSKRRHHRTQPHHTHLIRQSPDY